jgi:hypothetical protein
VLGRVRECFDRTRAIGALARANVVGMTDGIAEGGGSLSGFWEASLQRCSEKTLEPGKKRLHRWNKAGFCFDCGGVSHRAVRIKRLTAEWTCLNCRSDIEWTEQIVDQQKRDPRPGDSFICVECSTVSVVTPGNRLRPMTEAELLRRRPASQKIIRDARAVIKQR